MKAHLLLAALALQSCGPNVDQTHPDLHIERFGETNWTATSYKLREPPRERLMDPYVQPDELTTAIQYLTRFDGVQLDGVVSLLRRSKSLPTVSG